MKKIEKKKEEVIERLEDTISMVCNIYNESYENAMQSDDRNFRITINQLEVVKDRLVDFNLDKCFNIFNPYQFSFIYYTKI